MKRRPLPSPVSGLGRSRPSASWGIGDEQEGGPGGRRAGCAARRWWRLGWNMRSALVFCPLVIFLFMLMAPLSAEEKGPHLKLVFGVSEALIRGVYEEELEPITVFLRNSGVELVSKIMPNDQALADSLMRSEVDVGMFSPLSYVKAHRRHGALIPFGSHVINGTLSTRGYVLVRAASPIRKLADLKGRTFAFTDSGSFAGYAFPMLALLKSGIKPERDLHQQVLTGDYFKSLRLLFKGEVDGAAVLDEVLRLGEAVDMPMGSFRVLAKGPKVPYVAYVARPGLPRATLNKLKSVLTGRRFKRLFVHVRSPLEWPGPWARFVTRKQLRWAINGFVSVEDDDFDEIRRVIHQLRERLGSSNTD